MIYFYYHHHHHQQNIQLLSLFKAFRKGKCTKNASKTEFRRLVIRKKLSKEKSKNIP